MEGKHVIDKKKEVLLEPPSFTTVVTHTPVKLKPILLEPLPALKPDPLNILPEDILSRIGVKKEEKPSFLSGLFACNSCAACKAMSR